MKIWLVNQYAVPPTQAGITRHYAFARELQRRGHRVTIVASSFDHVTRRETRLGANETWRLEMVEDVPFLWLRTPAYRGNSLARVRNIFSFAWSVAYRLAGQGIERPDLVVGSSPTLFAALAARKLAARWKIPFVMEVRDLWPESLVSLGKLSRRHPLVKALALIEKHLYRSAAGIVTLLPNACEYIVARGGPPDKVFWVPNGVDLALFPAPNPPQGADAFRVLYAGSHGLANGLDAILDAAAILQAKGQGHRIRFTLVGDGPQKPRLIKRAHDEQIDNVEFLDPVPKMNMHRLLSGADAFIVTLRSAEVYRYGTSLNKIFDFLAAGRPIVFGTPECRNPVSESGAGLVVPPEDAPALAAAVESLAETPTGALWAMGCKGRHYVEDHFAIAGLCLVLENIFREVLDADRVPVRRSLP